MGHDLDGKPRSGEDAPYFRASCWSWPAIHGLILEAEARGFLEKLKEHPLGAWRYNGCPSLPNAEECDVLADALDRVLENDQSEMFYAERSKGINELLRFIGPLGAEEPEKFRTEASRDHVRMFIEFLRKSDGFESC